MGDIKESSVLLKTFGEGMKDVDTEGGGGGAWSSWLCQCTILYFK